jgi:sarcosine oxidase delta subunit
MDCPYCGQELKEEDTFGNTDYCLNAIGYHPDYPVTRNPVKVGNIYQCDNPDCENYQEYFYTLDEEGGQHLHEGYPC